MDSTRLAEFMAFVEKVAERYEGTEADTRLIDTAPDLLAFVKEIAAQYHPTDDTSGIKARALIARAEGRPA